MSVPNFRKSYHTVLGAAIDFNGTRIIIINIAAGSNGGFLQRLRTREKCIFCTICHCIEKSMLQTYQWDIQFEMQYYQDPQGPWRQAMDRAGPWSGHNVMKWCVCVLPSVWCVWKVCVCENWSRHARERRRREGEITLEITLAISQAFMFQIFTKNLLFILQSTFFQICVLNILKCLHMNL